MFFNGLSCVHARRGHSGALAQQVSSASVVASQITLRLSTFILHSLAVGRLSGASAPSASESTLALPTETTQLHGTRGQGGGNTVGLAAR